jgi:antitoxin Phd
MKTMQLREAKASLSAVVQAAQDGEPTILTKHGEPAAMVVPIAVARKLYPEKKPNFAKWLLSIPHEIPYERDQTPVREVEF